VTTIKIVRGTRVIPADSAAIFELLANPAEHARIDGSGSVRGAESGTARRLSLGATFGMQMRIGAPYKIVNEVVEFEEGRRIAWRHFGGHIWRYLLAPVGPETTEVTEEFDPTHARSPWVLRLIRAETRNQRSIDQTLERLEDWAHARSSRPGG
jgi:hypothetical protein